MSVNVSDHLTIELGKLRIVIKILLMFVRVAERGERLLDVMTHGQHGKGEVRGIHSSLDLHPPRHGGLLR